MKGARAARESETEGRPVRKGLENLRKRGEPFEKSQKGANRSKRIRESEKDERAVQNQPENLRRWSGPLERD